MAAANGTTRTSARERLLAAADELFYAEGVQTVGIDRIIERAGVAKASLYNTFNGKEQLVRAYLDARHVAMAGRINEFTQRYSTPRERMLAVFEAQGEIFAEPGFRGCAFANASTEAPRGGLVVEAADTYRAWVRALFEDLARQAGAADPEALARRLHLLYDGGGVSARMDRDPSSASEAREVAAILIDAALRDRPARTNP